MSIGKIPLGLRLGVLSLAVVLVWNVTSVSLKADSALPPASSCQNAVPKHYVSQALPIALYTYYKLPLNNRGDVLGTIAYQKPNKAFSTQAIMVRKGTQVKHLGFLTPETSSSGEGLSNVPKAVGISGLRPFVYDLATGMQELDFTTSGTFRPAGINANSQIAGMIDYPASPDQAVRYSPSTGLKELWAGNAVDINTSGSVIGVANSQAQIYTDASGVKAIGGWYPVALNDKNVVIGNNLTLGGYPYRYSLTKGTEQLAVAMRVNDINDCGVVAGTSPSQKAIIWRDAEGVKDVNTLINSPWVFTEAKSINSSAQLVAIGTRNGVTRAFLLTPKK